VPACIDVQEVRGAEPLACPVIFRNIIVFDCEKTQRMSQNREKAVLGCIRLLVSLGFINP